jgi:ubiquinone/menaquinone biosynthesis C-methylase UbiE
MPSTMPRQPEPEIMDILAEAKAYAETDFSDVNQRFVERLVELAGPREKAEALDLGTGPGDIPVRVVRARPKWRVTAVDASGAMLDFARRLVKRAGMEAAIRLVQADAKHTGLRAASFDVIFSNSILHHITDAASLWAEVKRLARRGAVVLFRDLARPASAEAAREIVKKYAGDATELLREEYYRSLLAAYTADEVRAQIEQAGLGALNVAMVSDRHLDVFGKLIS